MDAVVLAAVMGGICIVAALIVSIVVKHYLEERNLPSSSPARRAALLGAWSGVLTMESGSPEPTGQCDVAVNIFGRRRRFDGDVLIHFESGADLTGRLHDGRFDGRVLQIVYSNSRRTGLNWGTIYAELSSEGKRLTGNIIGLGFSGYGRKSDMVAQGFFYLEKLNER